MYPLPCHCIPLILRCLLGSVGRLIKTATSLEAEIERLRAAPFRLVSGTAFLLVCVSLPAFAKPVPFPCGAAYPKFGAAIGLGAAALMVVAGAAAWQRLAFPPPWAPSRRLLLDGALLLMLAGCCPRKLAAAVALTAGAMGTAFMSCVRSRFLIQGTAFMSCVRCRSLTLRPSSVCFHRLTVRPSSAVSAELLPAAPALGLLAASPHTLRDFALSTPPSVAANLLEAIGTYWLVGPAVLLAAGLVTAAVRTGFGRLIKVAAAAATLLTPPLAMRIGSARARGGCTRLI